MPRCWRATRLRSEVEVTEHAEMHRRYQIEAVPIVAIADSEGVVQRSFIGVR